jgi:hypothetical protein
MSNEQPQMSFTDFRFAVNLVTWIAHILSLPLNVFLHWGLGERAIGMPGVIVIPMLILYGTLLSGRGAWTIVVVLWLYILMCGVWRLYAIYRRRRLKIPVHSRYGGRPWLLHLAPNRSEVTIKRIEPLVVFLFGLATLWVNLPLAGFLVASAIGQALSLAITEAMNHAKMLDQLDAQIEQEQLAARSRDLTGRSRSFS